jgi:hypothetical protein
MLSFYFNPGFLDFPRRFFLLQREPDLLERVQLFRQPVHLLRDVRHLLPVVRKRRKVLSVRTIRQRTRRQHDPLPLGRLGNADGSEKSFKLFRESEKSSQIGNRVRSNRRRAADSDFGQDEKHF